MTDEDLDREAEQSETYEKLIAEGWWMCADPACGGLFPPDVEPKRVGNKTYCDDCHAELPKCATCGDVIEENNAALLTARQCEFCFTRARLGRTVA